MIYICIRRTTDWDNEDVFRAQLSTDFRPKVEAWNATFDMPYHIFRSRLKEIAQINLRRIKGAVVTTIDNVPKGGLIVPIDDDDWLSPDLAEEISKELEDGKVGYYWHRAFLEMPLTNYRLFKVFIKTKILGRSRLKWTCSTNNYAFVNEENLDRQLSNHLGASHYFDQNPARVKYLDKRLSLMNRSMASQTSLNPTRPGISSRRLKKNHTLSRDLYRVELTNNAWCKPYLLMMDKLMREIKPK
jgi:hypothetical protein